MLTSKDIRCITVKSPDKKEIERQLSKAKEIERTAYCKMRLPQIVTN